MGQQYVHEETLTIPQGTDFSDTITISVKNGDAKSLASFGTLTSKIRDNYTITSGITMAVTINHITNGILNISVASAGTAAVRSGWKVYDIVGFEDTGAYQRIAQGKVHITPGVT